MQNFTENTDLLALHPEFQGSCTCILLILLLPSFPVMNDLNRHYIPLNETEGCLVSPSHAQPCVARYSVDEMWYRAKILSLSVNNVAVQFVDYGNSETVCPSGVKQIKSVFTELPAAAMECSLDLSQEEWSTEQLNLFQELTGEKQLTVKLLQEKDGRYEVEVYEEGVQCISSAVLDQEKPKGVKSDLFTPVTLICTVCSTCSTVLFRVQFLV